jgi:predicted methyltransferase MtxX (methanogen marker protein 4)
MKKISQFEKIIQERIKLGKPKIGFGLQEPNREVLKSLVKSKKYADIVLVGPNAIKNVKGFQKVISQAPEKDLAKMLFNQEFDGIVRGTIDDFKTFEAYQMLIGQEKAKQMIELGLMEDFYGRQFFISQASNPLGWSKEEKIKDCEGTIKFMKLELGLKPKIGFITGVRHETYERKKGTKKGVQKILNQTYEDADFIVDYFTKHKIEAKNYAIEIETALKEGCNIIVPPNGMVGNQIFRTLVLVGGGKFLACSRANFPHPYEDNSRSETDFEPHIRWLVAWINGRKYKKSKMRI